MFQNSNEFSTIYLFLILLRNKVKVNNFNYYNIFGFGKITVVVIK